MQTQIHNALKKLNQFWHDTGYLLVLFICMSRSNNMKEFIILVCKMWPEQENFLNPMEYNGLMSFLSGIDSIIFILIYIYVALCLFKIWYPQLCEIIFKLSEIILNFLEEREENRLQRENDYLREAIKQNERTAYEDSMGLFTQFD